MNRLMSRVTFQPDGPVVGKSGVAVASVIEHLGCGDGWDEVMRALAIDSGDVIAAVAAESLGSDDSMGLPLTRGTPRRPALLSALCEPSIRVVAPKADLGVRLALAAGLLQVQDFWDASHDAAQAADNLGERDFSAYWHGIAHRREPDPGNAAYWFRRVGRHPQFGPLWDAVRPIAERFTHSEGWDPAAFTDFCTRARRGSDDETIARRVQRAEMLTLLNANAQAAGLV